MFEETVVSRGCGAPSMFSTCGCFCGYQDAPPSMDMTITNAQGDIELRGEGYCCCFSG